MYRDTVVGSTMVHRPSVMALMATVFFGLFLLMTPAEPAAGRFLAAVLGELGVTLASPRVLSALGLSLLLTLNIVLLGFLGRRVQIALVWLELLLLFLGSFYLLDLSVPFIWSKLWFMLSQGLVTTLYVSLVSIVLATVIAIAGAVAKLSDNGFAFAIASFYTSLFRGLPLIMQLYIIYLGLPQLGIMIGAVPAGIAALALCYGAYMTEIFRAGIQNIPRGQWEASRALGFRFGLTMRKIILPQAIPIIIPATGNSFISMLKDSSLVSVIGVWELMYLSRTMGTKTFQHMEMLMTAALIYWVMTILLELVQAQIEQRFRARGAR